jgi:predicted nucleotidyltransferase
MLQYFITSRAKRNVLRLLLTNPEKEFYINEISRLTGEPLNAVARETGYLEKSGLIKSHKAGNMKYFEVQKDFPLYAELKKIIYSTVGLGDYLSKEAQQWNGVECALIYGSVASGAESASSDIDLLVIGSADEIYLHSAVTAAEKDTGRTINYTIMEPQEFRQRLSANDPFIIRLLNGPKLMLKGNIDEYRAVIAGR